MVVKTIQTQVVLRTGGAGGRQLLQTGYMVVSELQNSSGWQVVVIGWQVEWRVECGGVVEEYSWAGSGGPAGTGHGMGGAVVGLCLPVMIVDEEIQEKHNTSSVRVVVQMPVRRVATGKTGRG